MDARTEMADPLGAAADLDPDPLSDISLVRQVLQGSQDALASLYDRHVGGVHATALRVGGDESLAAEVVQDTFLSLWNRAERYDPARGSLATWLQTIARNRTIDRLRAIGRRGPTTTFAALEAGALDPDAMGDWLTATAELVGAGEPEATPELALAASEQRSAIQAALTSLRETDRSVILLAYQAGLSQSEIAARLNWPLGTVKTRTRRGLHELRAWLERSEIDQRPPAPADRPAERRPPAVKHPCWPSRPARLSAIAAPCA
jgi:RNA polymerase sigma-70 factor, ECF subfamily